MTRGGLARGGTGPTGAEAPVAVARALVAVTSTWIDSPASIDGEMV